MKAGRQAGRWAGRAKGASFGHARKIGKTLRVMWDETSEEERTTKHNRGGGGGLSTGPSLFSRRDIHTHDET